MRSKVKFSQERAIEFFKIVASGPTQQGQVIDQDLGEVSRTSEVIHADFGQINAKFLRQSLGTFMGQLPGFVGKPCFPTFRVHRLRTGQPAV